VPPLLSSGADSRAKDADDRIQLDVASSPRVAWELRNEVATSEEIVKNRREEDGTLLDPVSLTRLSGKVVKCRVLLPPWSSVFFLLRDVGPGEAGQPGPGGDKKTGPLQNVMRKEEALSVYYDHFGRENIRLQRNRSAARQLHKRVETRLVPIAVILRLFPSATDDVRMAWLQRVSCELLGEVFIDCLSTPYERTLLRVAREYRYFAQLYVCDLSLSQLRSLHVNLP